MGFPRATNRYVILKVTHLTALLLRVCGGCDLVAPSICCHTKREAGKEVAKKKIYIEEEKKHRYPQPPTFPYSEYRRSMAKAYIHRCTDISSAQELRAPSSSIHPLCSNWVNITLQYVTRFAHQFADTSNAHTSLAKPIISDTNRTL